MFSMSVQVKCIRNGGRVFDDAGSSKTSLHRFLKDALLANLSRHRSALVCLGSRILLSGIFSRRGSPRSGGMRRGFRRKHFSCNALP